MLFKKLGSFLLVSPTLISSFVVKPSLSPSFETTSFKSQNVNHLQPSIQLKPSTSNKSTQLNFFEKMFEEDGTLGKGITVGKVQVALQAIDRSSSSIFGILEQKARAGGDSPQQLARLGNEVCIALLRKSDDWTAACSSSTWFSEKDAGKAERSFNDLANKEAAKFEKVRFTRYGSLCFSKADLFKSIFLLVFILIGIHSWAR